MASYFDAGFYLREPSELERLFPVVGGVDHAFFLEFLGMGDRLVETFAGSRECAGRDARRKRIEEGPRRRSWRGGG